MKYFFELFLGIFFLIFLGGLDFGLFGLVWVWSGWVGGTGVEPVQSRVIALVLNICFNDVIRSSPQVIGRNNKSSDWQSGIYVQA
jgi:hypothetical protein